MARFESHPYRLPSRCARRFRRLGWVVGLGAMLGTAACGQSGLVEPETPAAVSRALVATSSAPLESELLRASVEVFGIEVATLESSLCAVRDAGVTMETAVQAAPLVKVIRSTSGEAKTELLALGAAPRSSDYRFRDGDVVRHYQVDYRSGAYAYVYDNGGVERRTGVNEVPEGAEPHDMHSALLLLRAWRPRLDESAHFYVVLGRRPWRVDVTSRGPEMIKLGEQPRLTYRIDGVAMRLDPPGVEGAPSKRFSLWLSEEAGRVPLRMVADASFGQVTMTLTGRDTSERDCQRAVVARGTGPEQRPSVRPGLIGTAWSTPRVRRP
jgi:Protein of unknown function (DUF3108)